MSIEIPGYKIDKQIGSGGMATVYLALQENLHRKVALKVMTPGLAVDETYCHRFLKEGRIAAQLNHINLLTVYDIGVHESQYYMATEYLSGGTVRDRMKPAISEDDAITFISDIAQGLQYAHSNGFVHRDVKPGNMLFRGNGDCVLGDFGIAKAVDSNTGATKLGTSIGTPHYMSPEQAKGEKVDHRTDLYSLGVVFYEILVGKLPYDADDPFSVALMQINEPVPQLPSSLSKYQPVINKLMAKDREQRYRCADDFLDDLESLTGLVSGGRKTTKRRVDEPSRQGRSATPASARNTGSSQPPSGYYQAPSSNKLMYVAVALTVLIMIGGVSWYMLTRDKNPDPLPPTGEVTTTTPQNNTDSSTTEQSVEPVAVRDPQKSRIDRLLAQAGSYMEQGQYLTPSGRNAFAVYQQVLLVDPDNANAKLGKGMLANRLESQIEQMLSRGEQTQARQLASQAMTAFPNNLGIRYLHGALIGDQVIVNTTVPEDTDVVESQTNPVTADNQNQSSTAAPVSAEVQTVLERADNYFDQNIIAFPPGNNAMDLYLEVVKINPVNARANEQLEFIANMWAQTAESKIDEGSLTMAKRMIARGLRARPLHPRLLELQGQID